MLVPRHASKTSVPFLCRKNDSDTHIEVLRWEASENRRLCLDLKKKAGLCLQKDFRDFPTLSIYDENQLNSDFAFNFIKNEEVSIKGYVMDNINNPIVSSLVSIGGTDVNGLSMSNGFFELKLSKVQLSSILDEKQEISINAEHAKTFRKKLT